MRTLVMKIAVACWFAGLVGAIVGDVQYFGPFLMLAFGVSVGSAVHELARNGMHVVVILSWVTAGALYFGVQQRVEREQAAGFQAYRTVTRCAEVDRWVEQGTPKETAGVAIDLERCGDRMAASIAWRRALKENNR